MKTKKLKKVKKLIESFFYKARFNIALDNTLKSQEHKDFRDRVEAGIYKQILFFSKQSKIKQIVGMKKAVKELTDKELLENIEDMWVPLTTFVKLSFIALYIDYLSIEGGQSGVNKLGSDKKFELSNKSVLATIKRRPATLVSIVDKTTKDWIARTVEEGVKKNLSEYEIANMLRRSARSVARERADTIAEQEAALMIGEMELEVFKRNNIKFHVWVTSHDELVCQICMSNETGGKVAVGDEFPTGVLSSPAHIRCRCMTLPVFTDMEVTWVGK